MALLVQGSTGPEVKNLQTALNFHMPNALPPLAVDGVLGPRTQARVVQFQAANRLKPDGIVGPVTHQALYTFVECSHHLVIENRDTRNSIVTANRRAVTGDPGLPAPFRLPPIPRLQLTFPSNLPPMPSILQPPRLVIDPLLLFLARNTKFELEAGKETTFKKDLATSKSEREVTLFADLKGVVWSKPFGKKVEVSTGGGVVVEKRLRPTPDTETSVYVFAKVEVKDILRLNPIDLAKIAAEAQFGGKPGKDEPADMSVTVSAGPEVEVFDGAVTFGPGAYLEYKTNGIVHTLTSGMKVTGTFHF